MEYIVDVESKRLVSSFLSTRTITPEPVVFGDEANITVRLVEPDLTSDAFPFRYVDLSSHSIRVAIGLPGAQPTAGSYTLTFGADTTSSIAFDADATAIDTALNALASITAAGGVTVTSLPSGYLQVEFDSVGAQGLITATTDALYPASSAYIYEATAGDGSTKEVQIITLEQDHAAYAELTQDATGVAAVVSTVQPGSGSTPEIQSVAISGDGIGGFFTITIDIETTLPIAYNADRATIQAAIEDLPSIGAGNAVLTSNSTATAFTVYFSTTLIDVAEMTVDTSNITANGGKQGTITFDTTQFLELLDGNQQRSAILEIVKFDTVASTSETVLQQPILCRQDVIANTPASTTPFPTYAAASHTHVAADINAESSLDGYVLTSDGAGNAAWEASDATVAGAMNYKGGYVATADPSGSAAKGDTYTVTTGGTGAASYWSTALEVGDVIIAEIDNPASETDWTVVSRDINGAVTKDGTPANDQIGVWTGDGTLEGTSNLTWDGSDLNVSGTITSNNSITFAGDYEYSDNSGRILLRRQSAGALTYSLATLDKDGNDTNTFSIEHLGIAGEADREAFQWQTNAASNEFRLISYSSGTGVNKPIHILQNDDGVITDGIYLATDGDTGIGTTTPAEKLDVNGNVNVSGNIIVSGTVDGRDVAADGALAASAMQNLSDDTTPQLGGNLDVNGQAISDALNDIVKFNSPIRCNGTILGNHSTKTGDGTTTVDWNNFGGMVKFTFGAFNETFTFTDPTEAQCSAVFHMSLTQDGVGSRTVTWPASVKWPGGTAPTLSTGAGAVDLIKFVYDGTNYYGTYDLNFS